MLRIYKFVQIHQIFQSSKTSLNSKIMVLFDINLILTVLFSLLLFPAISQAFNSVPAPVWESAQDLAQKDRAVLYTLGVAHGVLAARQRFGSRGLSQYYPLGGSLLSQAVQSYISIINNRTGNTTDDMLMEDIKQRVAEVSVI